MTRRKSPDYLTRDVLKEILEKHGGQIQAGKLYLILAQRGYLVWGADIADVLFSFQKRGLLTYCREKDLVILKRAL